MSWTETALWYIQGGSLRFRDIVEISVFILPLNSSEIIPLSYDSMIGNGFKKIILKRVFDVIRKS